MTTQHPALEMGEFCIIIASVCFTNKGKQDKDSLLLSFSLNAFIGNALSTEGLKARATESVCVFCGSSTVLVANFPPQCVADICRKMFGGVMQL